ncbi:MAG: bifunctional metallophosphatase/5'-nucleotidase [Candidatus Riflebacteria bacterium]|nr:bifunctional metallophosphatase/5'-nucleotidase [Candidatus Riflebacteria bacterium]
MKTKKSTRLLTFVLCFLVLTPVFADKALTVLHTNDTHSRISSIDYKGKTMGGLIARDGLLQLIKREVGENNMLLLDAGDTSQGTAYFCYFGHQVGFVGADLLGYDATTMGNHEMDNGLDDLLKALSETELELICCNLLWKGTKKTVFRPYKVLKRNDLKIGVIGRMGHDAWNDCDIAYRAKMDFLDDTATVRKYAKRIRPYVDLVIVISHSEIENDTKLAEQVPEVDILIGGHSHKFIEKPYVIKSKVRSDYDNGLGGTIFVEAGEWGTRLGKLDLVVSKDGKIKKWDGKLIPVTPDYEIHARPHVVKRIRAYEKAFEAEMSEIIGHIEKDLIYNRDGRRIEPQPAGQFCAEAMKFGANADIAITNAGGIKAGLKAGNINKQQIYEIMPYNNTLTIFEMTGRQVQKMLDFIAKSGNTNPEVYQTAGVEADLYPEGAKNIRIGNLPIEPSKIYKVTTSSFMANGNSGGTELFSSVERIERTPLFIRNAMIDYTKHIRIVPDYEGHFPLKVHK